VTGLIITTGLITSTGFSLIVTSGLGGEITLVSLTLVFGLVTTELSKFLLSVVFPELPEEIKTRSIGGLLPPANLIASDNSSSDVIAMSSPSSSRYEIRRDVISESYKFEIVSMKKAHVQFTFTENRRISSFKTDFTMIV